jgi:hypothetical protein
MSLYVGCDCTYLNDYLSGISNDRLPRLAAPSLRQGFPDQPVPPAEQATPAVQADLCRLHRVSQHRQVQRHQHPPLQEGTATLPTPVLWIRIRTAWIHIHLGVLDPDPYWECGSISRSMEIDQSLQINLISYILRRLV